MDVTKKPTIRQVALGARNIIDRDDRKRIDAKRLMFLLNETAFFDDISEAREHFNIPVLTRKEDINQGDTQTIQLPHRTAINSEYLTSLTEKQRDSIEKYIYKHILQKWNLNFNFYTYIEWYFLYKRKVAADFVLVPNPHMYFLYKKYPQEYLRNSHTTSDIKFMMQQVRLYCGFYAPKDSDGLLQDIKIIMSVNKNKERGSADLKKYSDDNLRLLKLGSAYDAFGLSTTTRFIATDKLETEYDPDSVTEEMIDKERERLKKRLQRLKIKHLTGLKK